MVHQWKWIWMFGLLAGVPAAQGQNWGGVLDRLSDHVGQTVEGRLQGTSDKAVNQAFDKTDGTVDCAAGDAKCAAQAASKQSQAAAAPASAKCVATDVSCLKQAKANGQTVEIVNEEELDTLRCSSQDASCLQRAKKLGKKVEITD
jgi:hypothetical protein